MSYGQIGKQASKYREMQVLAASPGELIIMVYDHLLVQLLRAQAAPDLEARSLSLEKARAAMCELLVTLDREKGGALATQLAAIYSFLLGELSTLGVRPDARRFERITKIVRELRDAFATAVGESVPVARAALA
ncbi:MAG: flagellar export chaperone FliS [Gemmatimonadaceae bacterium]